MKKEKVDIPIMSLSSFLENFDFKYEHNKDNKIELIDTQGANLGDIESEKFDGVLGVLDRLDIYYHDYIYEDLCDAFKYEGEEDYSKILEWLDAQEDKTYLNHHIALVKCILEPDNVLDLLSCSEKELWTLRGQIIDEREKYINDITNPMVEYFDKLHDDIDNELSMRDFYKEKTVDKSSEDASHNLNNIISFHKQKGR